MAPTTSKLYTYSNAIFWIFYFCREELLDKLFMVMGINVEILFRHPDKSYVLTADNAKKILAILMRFRYYNIIVFILGLHCNHQCVYKSGVTFQLC